MNRHLIKENITICPICEGRISDYDWLISCNDEYADSHFIVYIDSSLPFIDWGHERFEEDSLMFKMLIPIMEKCSGKELALALKQKYQVTSLLK